VALASVAPANANNEASSAVTTATTTDRRPTAKVRQRNDPTSERGLAMSSMSALDRVN
jgi:hypothetical protein